MDGQGSNLPPVDVNPLRERLAETYADRIKRRDELLEAIARAPETIEDEETAKRWSDFSVKQAGAWLKEWDATRVAEKEPFLSAERTVDGFFHNTAVLLANGKKKIDAVRKKYLDDKAERERRARIEAERQAREEEAAARRAAEEAAKKIEDDKTLDVAIEAETEANKRAAEADAAAKAAAAKPAELSRVRGDFGSVSSLKSFPDFKDLNRATIDLEALREHLSTDCIEKALRSFCRVHAEGIRHSKITIRGATLFINTRL